MGHGLRLATMKCAESLEMRQAFAEVVSAGFAKGMSEGLKHEVEHRHAQRTVESLEAYDPEAEAKFSAALQSLKDLKLPSLDQLEGLKDAPMDVIMASLYLENDTGEDAPQFIRDLCLSSSQLTISVYPEMSNDKESSAAGTDNRAPILEEDDYESWKIRMERYIRSKGDGKKIWKSIMTGLATTPRTPILDATGEATTQTRVKTDDEFTEEENARELIDYKAASILDAMMATMDKIVNLLSGFQKQFPQTNNQLRASSNPRSHATVHDGWITTELVQRRAPDNVVNEDGHVTRQCKEKKREKDLQYFKDKVLLMKAKERGTSGTSSEVINEVHTYDHNLDDNNAPDDNNDPYDNCRPYGTSFNDLVLMADVTPTLVDEVVPSVEETTVLSPQETPNESPFEFEALFGLQAELHGYVLANREQLLEISNLNTELARCKLEIKDLDRNKVKHDLDQAIVDRNRRNEELRKETELLKAKLSFQTKVNETLESDKAQILSDKNPTHTIPMLSKKKTKLTTSDLHKHPDHERLSVWQSKATLALDYEKRAQLLENPEIVPPVDYKALNKLYDTFVSQKEPSHDQVYWQPPKEVTKPKTPYVHTRPKRSEVFPLINELKHMIGNLDPFIKEDTQKRDPAVNIDWWLHARMVVLDHFMPFIDLFRKGVYNFADILKKEINEFEKIFDDLAAEYDQGVKEVKCLEITNRNLVRKIDCLISDSIASEVSALVLTADHLPLETQDNPSCVRKIAKCLELEAKIGNLKK
nr:hypothetical protein [Tanacetum cinerariifolium]